MRAIVTAHCTLHTPRVPSATKQAGHCICKTHKHSYTHSHLSARRLLKDFFDCAPSASVEDVLDTLSASGTTVLKMVHTHEGAAVGCMLLAYGSAKDRKRLVKAMKGVIGDH